MKTMENQTRWGKNRAKAPKKLGAFLLAMTMVLSLSMTTLASAAGPVVDKSQMTASAISAVGQVTLNNVSLNGSDNMGHFWIDANGRTQAPVRLLVEAMGYSISYNKGVVTVPGGPNGDLVITIGSDKLTVGGSEVKMDTIGATIDGRTYIPLRFVAEALGATVEAKGSANGLNIAITTTFTPEKTINGVAVKNFDDCKNLQAVMEKYEADIYKIGTNYIRLAYDSFNMTVKTGAIGGGSITISGLNFVKEADKQYELIFAVIDDMIEEGSRQNIKDLLNEMRGALQDGWTPSLGTGPVGTAWIESHNGITQRFGNVNVKWGDYAREMILQTAS